MPKKGIISPVLHQAELVWWWNKLGMTHSMTRTSWEENSASLNSQANAEVEFSNWSSIFKLLHFRGSNNAEEVIPEHFYIYGGGWINVRLSKTPLRLWMVCTALLHSACNVQRCWHLFLSFSFHLCRWCSLHCVFSVAGYPCACCSSQICICWGVTKDLLDVRWFRW